MEERNVEVQNLRRYCVYMHIFPNNKKYIGITCKGPKDRWGKGGNGYLTIKNGKYTQPAIANAIKKYCKNDDDWDKKVEHRILYENLTKEEASEYEKKLIAQYDTTNSLYGYNIRTGGFDGVNESLCIPIVQLDLLGNYIAKYKSCAEAGFILRIDDRYIVDCKNHKRGHACGFMFIAEDEYDPNKEYKYKFPGREVVQFSIEGNYIATFVNAPEASKETGVNIVSIRSCCNDLNSTAGGFRWLFLDEWDGENLPAVIYDYKNKKVLTKAYHKTIQVNRYDNRGHYICTYDSVNDAAFDVGCADTNISRCCRETHKMIDNCYWRYANECDGTNDIVIETYKYNQHKPVVQLSLNGGFIAIHNSMKDAECATGVSAGLISGCCCGTQYSAGGYLWTLASEYDKGNIPVYHPRHTVAVIQLDLNGKFIKRYNSIKEAADETGIPSCHISACCQKPNSSTGGFQWVYEKDYDPNKIYPEIKPHKRRVVKLTINMEYVQTFDSVTEAAESVGKKTPLIIRSCKNPQVTAYGFKWMYEEDYLEMIERLDKLEK